MSPASHGDRPNAGRSALDELREEHVLILEVIERLEAAVSRDHVRPDIVRAALGFVRSFVDENHHGKEETVLFPLMQSDATLSELARSLGDDHTESRSLVAAIERTLDSGVDPDRLSRLVSSFASLLRDHIQREDHMVFEAAEAVLNRDDHDMLEKGFRRVEEAALGGKGAAPLLDVIALAANSSDDTAR